jgi:hypothetical protein
LAAGIFSVIILFVNRFYSKKESTLEV